VSASVRRHLNISQPMTRRDAWSATFTFLWEMLSTPRSDCPTKLPIVPLPPPSAGVGGRRRGDGTDQLNHLQASWLRLASSLRQDGSGMLSEEEALAMLPEEASELMRESVMRLFGRNPRESSTHPANVRARRGLPPPRVSGPACRLFDDGGGVGRGRGSCEQWGRGAWAGLLVAAIALLPTAVPRGPRQRPARRRRR